jgi:hypothetical protein
MVASTSLTNGEPPRMPPRRLSSSSNSSTKDLNNAFYQVQTLGVQPA